MTRVLILITLLLCATALAWGVSQVEYLSDLPQRLVFVQQGWGALGLNTCAYNPGLEPLPLQIGERIYEHGLGHHAPGALVYDLNGEYSEFLAEVGVQEQAADAGSVVFQVWVDGKKRYDSGLLRESDGARKVKVKVQGAFELRLVSTDGGDGITCDCANWAEARLVKADKPVLGQGQQGLDIAPFAKVFTGDANRMDGAQAQRTQEFIADDLYLDKPLAPTADGSYVIPFKAEGKGALGLAWLERRQLRSVSLEFLGEAPSPASVELQGWFGQSLWQGVWESLSVQPVADGSNLMWNLTESTHPGLRQGLRKLRWVFSPELAGLKVQKISAESRTRLLSTRLRVELESYAAGPDASVTPYNGTVAGASTAKAIASGSRLNVAYVPEGFLASESTLLRFQLPYGECAVRVTDVLNRGSVWAPDFGLYVTTEAGPSLAEYKLKTANQQTILERVRSMPDQTFAQAMEKTHNPIQDNGPMLISLASDNRKFLVHREGRFEFAPTAIDPNSPGVYPDPYVGIPHGVRPRAAITPSFGFENSKQTVSRNLWGGWLPAPETTVEEAGIVYRQRAFVVPAGVVDDVGWLSDKPLAVMEYEIENLAKAPLDARLALSFLADQAAGTQARISLTGQRALVTDAQGVMASCQFEAASLLAPKVEGGLLTLQGQLGSAQVARCWIYVPAWVVSESEVAQLDGGAALKDQLASYWERVLGQATRIEVPDESLTNIIKAAQVHCYLAARNAEEGRLVSPWIASMVYGPLESEANSILRGMALLGNDEFAKRGLDFFIRRYNAAGFLTTGYTLMGTGWQLRSVGEYYDLTKDRDWMTSVASEVKRVCDWVEAQRRKSTERPAELLLPETEGLMPPGVMADWGNYAAYFAANSLYQAGNERAGEALLAIGTDGAGQLLLDAANHKTAVVQAFKKTQALASLVPLRDGTWVPFSPSSAGLSLSMKELFPGEDGNRSWAYDVDIGAHHLISQRQLAPHSREARWIMDALEDIDFLGEGWFDYTAAESEADWFNRGGFSKVQPYYARNAEIYALRDDVKPFIRSYFNTLAAMVSAENLSHWEHFRNAGAFNKTHETGYFLQQTRFLFAMEYGSTLRLAPFVTDQWLKPDRTNNYRGVTHEVWPSQLYACLAYRCWLPRGSG